MPYSADTGADWVDLIAAADVPAGEARTVLVGARALAVCNDAGRFHVVDDTCPHAGGSLGQGTVRDGVVFCPWHNLAFSLANGRPVGGGLGSLRVYPSRVRGERVEARLTR